MIIHAISEGSEPTQAYGRYCSKAPGMANLNGVICATPPAGCGKTWSAAGHRLYYELPPNHDLRVLKPFPLPIAEFQSKVQDLRQSLSIPEEIDVLPGTRLGQLRVTIDHAHVVDLSSPVIGAFVVSGRLVNLLQEGGFTGWRTEPVHSIRKRPKIPLPDISELVIEGDGGLPITDPEIRVLSKCPTCGRIEYGFVPLRTMQLNECAWDGSDIFRFRAPYDGRTYVTDRLARAITGSGMSNVRLHTLAEVVTMDNGVTHALKK